MLLFSPLEEIEEQRGEITGSQRGLLEMRILEELYPSGQSEQTDTCDGAAGKYVGVRDTGLVGSCGEYNTLSPPLMTLKVQWKPKPRKLTR